MANEHSHGGFIQRPMDHTVGEIVHQTRQQDIKPNIEKNAAAKQQTTQVCLVEKLV